MNSSPNDVLIVQVAPTPTGGGAELIVRQLTAGLPTHGLATCAIYFDAPAGLVLAANETSLTTAPRNPLAILRLRRRIRQLLNQHPAIIVHAHLTWSLYYTRLATLGLPVTRVYTEHSTFNKRRRLPWLRPLERWIYRGYTRVACISEATRSALQGWLSSGGNDDRLVVLTNGARFFPFSSRTRAAGALPALLSIGSLTTAKGFDILVPALHEVRDRFSSWTVLGEGPERPRLEALICDLGMAEKIRLAGWCDDIGTWLAKTDILLVPSRWEGFGLAAVEAMSAGVPVLASNIPGLREVVADCSDSPFLVHPPSDPNAWAEALQTLTRLLDKEADAIHVACRDRASRFSLEQMIASYAALLARLR